MLKDKRRSKLRATSASLELIVSKIDALDEKFHSMDSKVDTLDECVRGMDKKLDLHIQKTELEFSRVRELDVEQNRILEEHHKRSTELKRDNDLRETSLRKEMKVLDARLERVEFPKKAILWARRMLIWVASAAGAVAAIYTLLAKVLR
jgi:phage-related tail protein